MGARPPNASVQGVVIIQHIITMVITIGMLMMFMGMLIITIGMLIRMLMIATIGMLMMLMGMLSITMNITIGMLIITIGCISLYSRNGVCPPNASVQRRWAVILSVRGLY